MYAVCQISSSDIQLYDTTILITRELICFPSHKLHQSVIIHFINYDFVSE